MRNHQMLRNKATKPTPYTQGIPPLFDALLASIKRNCELTGTLCLVCQETKWLSQCDGIHFVLRNIVWRQKDDKSKLSKPRVMDIHNTSFLLSIPCIKIVPVFKLRHISNLFRNFDYDQPLSYCIHHHHLMSGNARDTAPNCRNRQILAKFCHFFLFHEMSQCNVCWRDETEVDSSKHDHPITLSHCQQQTNCASC